MLLCGLSLLLLMVILPNPIKETSKQEMTVILILGGNINSLIVEINGLFEGGDKFT